MTVTNNMKRREYNEVYGYLSKDVINSLPEMTRRKMFLEYITSDPTATGWFITRTVVAALGDKFINYMIERIIEVLQEDGEEITKDSVLDSLATMMECFAKDANSLMEYVRTYREEVLGLDDTQVEEIPEDIVDDMIGKTKKDSKPTPKREKNGRFTKKN